MDPARRFMLAGLGVAALEAALGLVALSTGIALYLFACAGATTVLAVVARRLVAAPRDDEDDDSRGGPPRGPDDPPPPPWWPEFEARFREHARRHERERPVVH